MKKNRLFVAVWVLFAALVVRAETQNFQKGFSLTEIGDSLYDAAPVGAQKTSSQVVVDNLFQLGTRHITLSPRAFMRSGYQSFLELATPLSNLPEERQRYLRLIDYIHSKGMTVGIRPIFFLVDANGNTPLVEKLPEGGTFTWWHGNILPEDPAQWFKSFQSYLENYADIAKIGKVEEFTIGAELQSVTVGYLFEGKHTPGYPERWVTVAQNIRKKLLANTKIVYDINYTDASILAEGQWIAGGEFALWKEILIKGLTIPNSVYAENARNLALFIKQLDSLGIDMYRSLASSEQTLPTEYNLLVQELKKFTDYFAWELMDGFTSMGNIIQQTIPFQIKEVGYRSIDKGFINPFDYTNTGPLNIEHQAAAYTALFQSFLPLDQSRFLGLCFWDASVDLNRHGSQDKGFSPIGKQKTEEVFKQYLGF